MRGGQQAPAPLLWKHVTCNLCSPQIVDDSDTYQKQQGRLGKVMTDLSSLRPARCTSFISLPCVGNLVPCLLACFLVQGTINIDVPCFPLHKILGDRGYAHAFNVYQRIWFA